jgi:hypothetical protein
MFSVILPLRAGPVEVYLGLFEPFLARSGRLPMVLSLLDLNLVDVLSCWPSCSVSGVGERPREGDVTTPLLAELFGRRPSGDPRLVAP